MTARKASFSHALFGLLLLVGTAQGQAQNLIPGMKSGASSQTAAQNKPDAEADSLDAQVKTLQQRLAKLQSQILQVPPVEASDAEWNQYLQRQTSEARTLTAHVNALNDLAEERRTEEDRAAARNTWKGFGQKPPYTIELADNWWAQVRRIGREIEATRVEQRLIDNMFEQEKKNLKAAQQAKRLADEQLQTSDELAQAARLRWLAELAGAGNRQSENRLGLFEALRNLQEETAANLQTQQQWLESKATEASRSLTFSLQERDRLLARLAEQSQAITQKTALAEKEEQQAQTALGRIRAQLATGRSSPELLQQLETARVETDVADGRMSSLRLLNYGNSLMQQAWQQRYQGMQAHDSQTVRQSESMLQAYQARMGEWRSAVRADSDRVQASLALLGTQLAEWKPGQGDRQQVERQYQAYQTRDALLRQNQSQIEQLEGMLYNWQQIGQLASQELSWSGRLRGAWITTAGAITAVWNFELITVDDTIVVEGREITGKRSVTLGKLVQVLLILVLGLWLTGRISAYARRWMLKRYAGDESAALLWLRLASIGMGVGLVVLALITAHIPLTAFAFMGGALALGLGFGAQNILNNFISGMILLVEKPIKLGDIVEVDGIRGRVHDIGSRCCQVQRYDGIDMLIPNSVFLERTVTNWTLSDQLLRFSVTVGIAYGSPIETAMRLVREAVTDHASVLKVPMPLVLLEDFGDNALLLRVDYWLDISLQDNSRQVASEIRLGIDKRFAEHGIAIPFPQRDVHLDSREPIRVEMVAAT
ncbi:mechanosensitive ion channel domain-containing protein [Thiobacillus sp.]|uniref:mechanosensitive ion channel domain-containing protein n=1 Tax=Thiobacillus sp. TaxID=924 RepID=UPI0025F07E44|nr:mechanosensitive ion channel domain-containing protein [Thiobacillus sp.]MBT9539957.1 mechanosensitive ion channel [Thiobacillus sp.]MBT9540880.1 mechanosensitive ion channel [Thiobacillus sp.]